MKIIDLLNARPVLESLVVRKMPAKLAYAVAKNYRLITSELEIYDKIRIKLLSDNWPLDVKANNYIIPADDQEKWKKMVEELVQTESDYQPFKIDLALTEQVDWSPAELLSLWFIFQGDGSIDLAPTSTNTVEV